jgi:hypothetical protein
MHQTPRVLASSRVQNAIILGAPLMLIVFSLAHGVDWLVAQGMHEDYSAFIQFIVDIRAYYLGEQKLAGRWGSNSGCLP